MRTGGCCRTVDRETSRFPHKERLHMPGSLTTPDRPGARNGASGRVAFRKMHCVGIQNRKLSRLNGWPMRPPVNASPRPSRAPAHELGADVDRYSFIARDLHPLLLAGLPAHANVFRCAPETGLRFAINEYTPLRTRPVPTQRAPLSTTSAVAGFLTGRISGASRERPSAASRSARRPYRSGTTRLLTLPPNRGALAWMASVMKLWVRWP